MLKAEHLMKVMPALAKGKAEEHLPFLLKACGEFGINTKGRFAAFLANVALETGELAWLQELDSFDGTYLFNKPYYPYYGRGIIHLTWKGNYQRCGDFLGLDLVNNPDLAKDLDVAWRIGGFYWTQMGNHLYNHALNGATNLNAFADEGDFDATVYGVNGGWNHYDERVAYYNAAMAVLPDEIITPSETAEHTSQDKYPTVWLKRDEQGYLRDGEGRYARLEDQWAQRAMVGDDRWLASLWRWQEGPVIPKGSWLQQHPTRYNFRSDVEKLIVRLQSRFPGVTINTYVDHPTGYGLDTISFDVWGEDGRGDPVGSERGSKVFDYLFSDPKDPLIWWIIWNRRIWERGKGFKPYGNGDPHTDDDHVKHVHVTFF